MKNSVGIELDLEAEEAIKKLERIKQLLKDIKELDSNFNISNVIETNKDTILAFNLDSMLKPIDIEKIEMTLSNKLKTRCIVLDRSIKLDKAINITSERNTFKCACDYGEAKDYTVINYYAVEN